MFWINIMIIKHLVILIIIMVPIYSYIIKNLYYNINLTSTNKDKIFKDNYKIIRAKVII